MHRPPFPHESIARHAPLGSMALSFDGRHTIATADLPAGLLPCAENCVLYPFTLTFWMNVPGPRHDAATRPGQAVLEIFAHDTGMVASWSIALGAVDRIPSLTVTWRLAGTTLWLALPAQDYTGQWVYVAASYRPTTPPAGDDFGLVTLDVTNGGPDHEHTEATLASTVTSPDVTRQLTLGASADPGTTGLAAYRGQLTRVRLHNAALDRDRVLAVMYDYPIGPFAMVPSSLVGDWRINEGYGGTAFDYAGTRSSLSRRYRPPAGNHLRLGLGAPHTEPVWVVADIPILVGNSAHTRVSTRNQPADSQPPAGPAETSQPPAEPPAASATQPPTEPAPTGARARARVPRRVAERPRKATRRTK